MIDVLEILWMIFLGGAVGACLALLIVMASDFIREWWSR